MASSVNLMTDRAALRAASERILRGWALAICAVIVLLAPALAWTWRERTKAIQAHEALEAKYEPLRRLARDSRSLGAETAKLTERERTALELSNNRPVGVLLSVVASAVHASRGGVFVEHVNITQDGAKNESGASGRLFLDFSSTLSYDVSELTKLLDKPPIKAVKIVSSETIDDGVVPRKTHAIECEF